MLTKDFTCHCARCDNPADDTRQFSCFDVKCTGQHYACQPINKDPLLQRYLHYTGVEYVEPHLLPCTLCNRTPPAEYQQRMFALENSLPEDHYTLGDLQNSYGQLAFQWNELSKVYVPPLHARSMNMLCHRFGVQVRMANDFQALYETGLAYVRLFEVMAQFPNDDACDAFRDIASVGFIPAHKKGSVPGAQAAAVKYAGKGLRMYLLLRGRDKPTTTGNAAELNAYYDVMVEALALQGGNCSEVSCTSNCCLVCGENLDCADVVLSRCGNCNQAQYCSVGCQRAHWKFHKKHCCA